MPGAKEVVDSLMSFDVNQQNNFVKYPTTRFTWTFSSTLELQKAH